VVLKHCVQEGHGHGEKLMQKKEDGFVFRSWSKTFFKRHSAETNKTRLIYFRFKFLLFAVSKWVNLSVKLSKTQD
jgi:hypothetical protein